MIKSYVADCVCLPEATPDEVRKIYAGVLPDERIEKICRIRHSEVRKQSLCAGLLLHHVLDRLSPGAQLTYQAFGKPLCAGLAFSLSHTENAVLVSVWDGQDSPTPFSKEAADFFIGCDIEKIRPYRPHIARRYFTKPEYDSLESIKNPQEQAELFSRYWTKKESVLKLTGLGMLLPMDLFDIRSELVQADRDQVQAWYEKQDKERQAQYGQAASMLQERRMYLKEYRHQGCCVTVCALAERFAEDVEIVNIKRLSDW